MCLLDALPGGSYAHTENNAGAYFFKNERSGMPASGAMRVRILGKSSPNLIFSEAVLTFIEAFFPYHSCSADFMALHSCRQSLFKSSPPGAKSDYRSSAQFLFGLTVLAETIGSASLHQIESFSSKVRYCHQRGCC